MRRFKVEFALCCNEMELAIFFLDVYGDVCSLVVSDILARCYCE